MDTLAHQFFLIWIMKSYCKCMLPSTSEKYILPGYQPLLNMPSGVVSHSVSAVQLLQASGAKVPKTSSSLKSFILVLTDEHTLSPNTTLSCTLNVTFNLVYEPSFKVYSQGPQSVIFASSLEISRMIGPSGRSGHSISTLSNYTKAATQRYMSCLFFNVLSNFCKLTFVKITSCLFHNLLLHSS